MISEKKLSILHCPKCKSDLSQEGNYVVCSNCNTRYPVVDDIIIFLTKDDLSAFLGETWGKELLDENLRRTPDFFYASNEDIFEDLKAVCDIAKNGAVEFQPSVDLGLSSEEVIAIRNSREAVTRLSRARSAGTILDWPTGTGYYLGYLANQVNPETQIVALDIDLRRLAVAKALIEKKNMASNILFVIADARKMPFKDNTFQAVTAWGGTIEIENAEAGHAETYRVLQDSGWFGVDGEVYNEDSPSMQIAEEMGFGSAATKDRLETVMVNIGFKNLEYEVLYEGYDIDLDTPDEDRCPLPARGDWHQFIAAAGQK